MKLKSYLVHVFACVCFVFFALDFCVLSLCMHSFFIISSSCYKVLDFMMNVKANDVEIMLTFAFEPLSQCALFKCCLTSKVNVAI